ncbi:MAG: DNA ligase D [Chitinophagaceae bacterium]
MPQNVRPMLATLANEPFNSDEWIFEIKWDGYRAVAYLIDGEVSLLSRNLSTFTDKYFPVAQALKDIRYNTVLDSEIVAIDEKNMANFQMLQNWQNTPAHLKLFVFDILWLEGYDVTDLPLIQRKNLLKKILPQDHEIIKFSDHIEGDGKSFFEAAAKQGLEGIMAKRSQSIYTLNSRAESWLKIKVNLRQEVIIAGFTKPRNARKYFGALLLGIYEGKDLVYIGHTGGGFNYRGLEEVYNKLQPLIIDECPFVKSPRGNMPITWVKPKLVCEIKFSEWTKDKIARQPIFLGLREDKNPKEIHLEKATITSVVNKRANPEKTVSKKAAVKTTKSAKPPVEKKPAKSKSSGLALDLNEGKDQVVTIDGNELKLTNLDKLYWKKEKGTKLDLINYYLRMAPFVLPYMLDRPQSLNRHPNGIEELNFYQKDMKGKAPEWAQTHIDFSESTNQNVEYLVCANEATLIYMANLGCIEMHPWHSRTQSWQQPDWCLIDLDPDDKNTFDEVIQVAQVVKKLLDSIGVDSCVKTSGSSGIHIYIPLGAQYSYDQSRQLAELIVTLVHQELPDFTSVIRNPAKRKGKIYLDFLQNREIQTAACAYSLRPKRGMPVSTPLHWDEVKKGLTPTTYHINNIFDRVKTEGDLFKPVLGKGINLANVLKRLSSIMK